jgi:hypothetical protein
MLTTCASAMVLEVQSNTASKTRIRFMVLGEGSEQRKEQVLCLVLKKVDTKVINFIQEKWKCQQKNDG